MPKRAKYTSKTGFEPARPKPYDIVEIRVIPLFES